LKKVRIVMEGPPVRLIAERLARFRGNKVLAAGGNTKAPKEILEGKTVRDVFNRGKVLFLRFPDFSLRVHFLMFGSYRIDEEREGVTPRLGLVFDGGTLNFYYCSVRIVENEDLAHYPEHIDIGSEKWDMERVLERATAMAETQVCDVLLDQTVFAGVGNIIKNEALFLAGVDPRSLVKRLPAGKLRELARQARLFSLLFYEVRKRRERLGSHLRMYRKEKCPECGGKVTWKKTGSRRRMSYYCPACQPLKG
jgi:endonuclease-8